MRSQQKDNDDGKYFSNICEIDDCCNVLGIIESLDFDFPRLEGHE